MVKISVIMGIYNCESTLSDAIESIINQTYTDWELIMCDDGSDDNTFKVAQKYSEEYENIFLLKNTQNKGLNYTLNKCLKYAKGRYIARQDGDDVSLPNRFEQQIKILENSDYAVVSSSMIHFDEQGEWGIGTPVRIPEKLDFIKGSPICHAPCIVKHDVFKEVGGYTESKYLLRVEDYHLWFKIYAKGYKAYNIETPLYKVFDGRAAFGRRKFKYRLNEAYVKFIGFKMLKIPFRHYIYVFRPILVGILPEFIYKRLRKFRFSKNYS